MTVESVCVICDRRRTRSNTGICADCLRSAKVAAMDLGCERWFTAMVAKKRRRPPPLTPEQPKYNSSNETEPGP